MYGRAAVAVFSFWSLLASAADWQTVADTTLGQLQLDRASVSTEGKFNKAVLVYRFKALQRLTTPPKDAFNKRQDEVLVDCSGKTLGIVTSRFFEDEKLASSFSLKASDVKFNPSAPGTMTETVILAVCAVKPS